MENNFSRKELTIKGIDDRLYNLVIIKEQNEISFKSNIINNIWDIKYILNLELKDFYYINETFRKYNSINEVYSRFFNDIREEQISISSNDNKIIVYFSDNDEVKIPFTLESNDNKIFNIIRKLCDKMEDIDALKNELDKQKIENVSLKNELEKRRNDDEENKKKIEELQNLINRQKELYSNQLGEVIKEVNQMKKDIEELKKNKGNNNKNNNNNNNMIKFDKNEIKQNLEINKANFFEIEDIKITNIGNKEFEKLFFVIDTDISSKNMLFNENSSKKNHIHRLCLDGPFLKRKNLNNIVTLYIKDPKIGEYNIFIYARESPDGDNLSSPLKITVNLIGSEDDEIKKLIEKYLKIGNKDIDKKQILEMYKELEAEFYLSSTIEKEEIIKAIIKNNCDRNNINEWIAEIM